jgi:formate-dependent nitrite reductase cytochrome c552 subunit
MKTAVLLCISALIAASPSHILAQGMPPEAQEKIHHLFENHGKIQRTVTVTDTGYTALTESDDPATAAALKAHVKQMGERIKSGLMVRRWDPAFAEYVTHYDEMEHRYEATKKGMKATVTGKTRLAIQIAQNHAKVISEFAAEGWKAHDRKHPSIERGNDNSPGGPRRGR